MAPRSLTEQTEGRPWGISSMEFTGIVYPEQLWVLTEVLERRCDGANIKPGTPEYEAEGARIISVYASGARTIYQLLAALYQPPEGCPARFEESADR